MKGQSAFFFKFSAKKYKLVQKRGFKVLKTQLIFFFFRIELIVISRNTVFNSALSAGQLFQIQRDAPNLA